MATAKRNKDTWLTGHQASEHSGLSRDRILALAREGKIASQRGVVAGTQIKQVQISQLSLDDYLKTHANGRGRRSGARAYVVKLPDELLPEFEALATKHGIELKLQYKSKPKKEVIEDDDTGEDEEEEETEDEGEGE